MRTIKAFVKRHPLLNFFALVFAISWGGMLLIIGAGGPGGYPMLAWVAGPPTAGIALIGLLHGKVGFRDLLSRMTRWKVGARWYAVALLTAPLVFATILLSLSLISPDFLPRILTTTDMASLLLFGIGWGLIGGGLLEELGWTGFAVPTLLKIGLRCPRYRGHRGCAVGAVALPRVLLDGQSLRSAPAGHLRAPGLVLRCSGNGGLQGAYGVGLRA